MALELGDAKFVSCWGLESPETKSDYWEPKQFQQDQADKEYEWVWSFTF